MQPVDQIFERGIQRLQRDDESDAQDDERPPDRADAERGGPDKRSEREQRMRPERLLPPPDEVDAGPGMAEPSMKGAILHRPALGRRPRRRKRRIGGESGQSACSASTAPGLPG